MATMEQLSTKLENLDREISRFAVRLNDARNAMIAEGKDNDPFHPLYKAWKELDNRDSQMRQQASDLRDEIEYLED